jgi:hypothetical protein
MPAGVGRLGLPLSVEQAGTLKSVAEQAPHGKGMRTVLDTTVRDALQVGGGWLAGMWCGEQMHGGLLGVRHMGHQWLVCSW